MDVLTVKNLNKKFKGEMFQASRHVLQDVSFSIPEGKTTGFVGSNGAGKTTTIKCIFEFIHRDSGDILLFNKPLDLQSRARIGYLPERPYLYEFLTGIEFLSLHWKLCYGRKRDQFLEKAKKALIKVDLWDARDRRLRTYSKGMLQRIGIAQAILTDPDLIILDEPMSGLDPDGRNMVKDILREEQKQGKSLFFSSHLLLDMEELCSDLVVINKGKIIYNGALNSFMSEYQSLEKAFSVLKKKENGNV